MRRKVIIITALLAASMSLLIASAALYSRGTAAEPDTAEPAMNAEITPDPEEQARQEELAAKAALEAQKGGAEHA